MEKKILFSIAPFIAPSPEPPPRPSACYITTVWPHSMNTLIQRWLSRQQCADPPSPPHTPIGCWMGGFICDLLPHLPVSWAAQSGPESRSCSTDTVSHSAKGRCLMWQSHKEHNLFLCLFFKVEPNLALVRGRRSLFCLCWKENNVGFDYFKMDDQLKLAGTNNSIRGFKTCVTSGNTFRNIQYCKVQQRSRHC